MPLHSLTCTGVRKSWLEMRANASSAVKTDGISHFFNAAPKQSALLSTSKLFRTTLPRILDIVSIPIGGIVYGTPEATIILQAVAAESTLCPAQPGQARECSLCCLVMCLGRRHMVRRQVDKRLCHGKHHPEQETTISGKLSSIIEKMMDQVRSGLRGYAAQRDAQSAVRPPITSAWTG